MDTDNQEIEFLTGEEKATIVTSACRVRPHKEGELSALVDWAVKTRVASGALDLVLGGYLSVSMSDDGVPQFKTLEAPEKEVEEETECQWVLDKLFEVDPDSEVSANLQHLRYAIEGYTYRVSGGCLEDRPYHPGGARDNSWSSGWQKADRDIASNPKINEL